MRIPFVILCVLLACVSLMPGQVPIPVQPAPSGDRPKWPGGRTRKQPGPASAPAAPAAPAAPVGRDTTTTASAAAAGLRDPKLTALADERFRTLDRDGDGFLSDEEMTETLQREWRKWDANQDGKIDRNEWRNYVAAFHEQRRREAKAAAPATPARLEVKRWELPNTPPAMKKNPTVFGEGLMPVTPTKPLIAGFNGGIPPWFIEYDTDGDGQVSLEEWTAKGGSLDEFRQIDQNRDGFITDLELSRIGKEFLARLMKAVQKQNRAVRDHPDAKADPGDMTQFRGQVGSTHLFRVTGRTDGGIWGSDAYTDDSAIAVAAVHIGAVKPGQVGVVRVTVQHGMQQYTGSARFGVTSASHGPFPGSYNIAPVH